MVYDSISITDAGGGESDSSIIPSYPHNSNPSVHFDEILRKAFDMEMLEAFLRVDDDDILLHDVPRDVQQVRDGHGTKKRNYSFLRFLRLSVQALTLGSNIVMT